MTKTIELQKEIRMIANKLGWSLARTAREIYIEKNDIDNDEEIRRFEQKFSKYMQRSTTKSELLTEYLQILTQHPDLKRCGLVLPLYRPAGILEKTTEIELSRISRALTDSLLSGNKL